MFWFGFVSKITAAIYKLNFYIFYLHIIYFFIG